MKEGVELTFGKNRRLVKLVSTISKSARLRDESARNKGKNEVATVSTASSSEVSKSHSSSENKNLGEKPALPLNIKLSNEPRIKACKPPYQKAKQRLDGISKNSPEKSKTKQEFRKAKEIRQRKQNSKVLETDINNAINEIPKSSEVKFSGSKKNDVEEKIADYGSQAIDRFVNSVSIYARFKEEEKANIPRREKKVKSPQKSITNKTTSSNVDVKGFITTQISSLKSKLKNLRDAQSNEETLGKDVEKTAQLIYEDEDQFRVLKNQMREAGVLTHSGINQILPEMILANQKYMVDFESKNNYETRMSSATPQEVDKNAISFVRGDVLYTLEKDNDGSFRWKQMKEAKMNTPLIKRRSMFNECA